MEPTRRDDAQGAHPSIMALLVASVLLLSSFAVEPATAAAATLTYRFTARSFLPAACHHSYADLNRVWNYTTVSKTGSNVHYPNDFASSNNPQAYVGSSTHVTGAYDGRHMCRIWNDIANGRFDGHPDFELPSGSFYAQGCSGTDFALTDSIYGGQQCDTGEKLSKIVENDLVEHEDGLPKPRYCTNNGVFPQDPRCGWRIPQTNEASKRVTTAGPKWFDMWYRDNEKYNLRVGYTLQLTETSANSGIFQFASNAFFPLSPNFAGTSGIVPCVATVDRRIDCSQGGRTFPLARKIDYNEDQNGQYSFTSEHHSFFQLRGTEKFTFQGDDDVWVFLNGKLAVDVGGLHSELTATIDLSNAYVREQLDMEIGGIYSLDMYHAERRTSGSNFRITTGLTSGCNIIQSGKSAYTWSPSTILDDWKLIGGPTWGIVENDRIILTTASETHTVGYAFLRQQVNVGTGFVINFKFQSTAKGEGFVFVLQRDEIKDLNGGSGGHLGFRNTLNSIGVVFDMCVDRDEGNLGNPDCESRQARLHYLPNGGRNDATDSTRVLRAPFYFPVAPNDNKTHTVTINYFGESPPWLEVTLDNDIILQKRGINLTEVIGGRNAFIGFTGSTGYTAATTQVYDVTISSVAIDDARTQPVNFPSASGPFINSTADGRKPASVAIQNYDACENLIEFGGFSSRAHGIMILRERDNSTTTGSSVSGSNLRRQLQTENETIVAQIVDRDDGKYTLEFRTTTPGVYDLKVWYGEDCFENGNNTGPVVSNPPSSCFVVERTRAAVFAPAPSPFVPDEPLSPDGLPQSAVIGIGIAAGIISAVGAFLIFVGIRIRNRWRRDKAFIDAGRQAVAERDVQYLGDADLDELQQRLQSTLHAIQAERAKKLREGDKQAIIDELNRQRGELQEQVRRLKIKMTGGDPNEPEQTGIMSRARKSFAASRASRGVSMRMSRGWSIMQGAPAISENTEANLAAPSFFSRVSMSLRRGGPSASSAATADPAEQTSSNPLFPRLSISRAKPRVEAAAPSSPNI